MSEPAPDNSSPDPAAQPTSANKKHRTPEEQILDGSSTDIYHLPTQDFQALTPSQVQARKAMFKTLDSSPVEPSRHALPPSASGLAPTSEPKTFNPVTDPMPERIGRAKLQRQLGQGSMGVVYEGRDELLDLPVALKIMRSDLMLGQSNHNLKARFLREAQLAIRVSHPNMVRLYDVGEYAGTLYMSYEFVDGGTLEDLLMKSPGRRLDVARTVQIMRDILLALGEASRAGIVHRDVKPANILLTSTGQAKLSDLGLAKGMFGGEINVTQPTMVVGTPAYMAPEQAIAGRKVDVRADLYAVGVMMFQLLTGRLPFVGTNAMEMLLEHQNTAPPDPCEEEPTIPRALGDLILKLMVKDPEKRCQTPEEVIAELDRICPEAPDGKCPELTVVPGVKVRSPWCWVWWFAAGSAVVIVIAGVWVWLGR